MQSFADHLRAESAGLTLSEALARPVGELIGVGPDAVAALGEIAVETIFDLGSSVVFAQAAAVVAAASAAGGALPTDVLADGVEPVPLSETPALPLAALRGLSSAEAAALSSALEVSTLRELAFWPPRQTAHLMVGTAAGTTVEQQDDPGGELRPRFGEYPTERVYYDSLVLLGSTDAGELTPLTAPLSVRRIVDEGTGFGTPAVGALATYSQSWFAQGITLGHMTHSLALAPGEATRIAVVDWTRRTSASTSESVSESEQLASSQDHARAVSEVQNAVADEMQHGGSMSTGWAKSSSKASGMAGSIGGGLAGAVGSLTGALGFGFGGSTSSQSSQTSSGATSTSWSVGSRSVMAEMSQRVNDRTEQHATSVRNRRATAVREVSQAEHEQVSTRIVANYNHMHALTVQYYEVVQVYRVTVALHRFERVLFLPFELIDFSAPSTVDLVARFRGELLRAALTPRAAELLLDDRGRVEVRSAVRVLSPFTVLTDLAVAPTLTAARLAGSGPVASAPAAPVGPASPVPPVIMTAPGPRRGGYTVTRPGPVAEVLPGDAELVSLAFEDVSVTRVRLEQSGVSADDSTYLVPGATMRVDLSDRLLLRSVTAIHVARDSGEDADGTMVLRYRSEGHESIAEVPLSLTSGTAMQKVAFLSGDAVDRRAELLDHLQANRAYYTRAVFENLDAASLAMLLSGSSWQGRPLADQVEPNPVAVTGNYLVLRAPAELDAPSGLGEDTWGALLDERGITFADTDERLVPIPTGGVFAEAVLGRSNSAEKLDITRFWNWQDSPVPLTPPEIAPVATGSRGTAENLIPGQLGAPVLNVLAPSALPEPAGLSAALGALANGSMFRDMSGLAGTQAAAQAASAGTLAAATEAGRIASANYQAATNQATEMGKAAADMWKVRQGGKTAAAAGGSGGSGSGGAAGVSGDGARINQGKDLDRRGVGGSSTPRVTGTKAEFASSDERVAPQFSRELAYSDEAAAASPDLLGASTAALGSVAASGQAGSNLLGSIGDVANAAVDLIGGLLAFLVNAPAVMLQFFERDATAAGLNLAGVRLLPMTLHDNHVEFEQVEYLAWTNTGQHVYVNLKALPKLLTDLTQQQGSPALGFAALRAYMVVVIKHELEHVTQFNAPTGHRPQTFEEMIDFEVDAYTNTEAWIASGANRTAVATAIGGSSGTALDDLQDSQDVMAALFRFWQSSITGTGAGPEAQRRAAMLQQKNPTPPGSPDGPVIPPRLKAFPGTYAIGDLYVTKPPPP